MNLSGDSVHLKNQESDDIIILMWILRCKKSNWSHNRIPTGAHFSPMTRNLKLKSSVGSRAACGWAYDTATVSDCAAANGGMVDEWWIGKDLEGSSRGLIENYPGMYQQGLKKTTKPRLWYPVSRPTVEPRDRYNNNSNLLKIRYMVIQECRFTHINTREHATRTFTIMCLPWNTGLYLKVHPRGKRWKTHNKPALVSLLRSAICFFCETLPWKEKAREKMGVKGVT
jgi:hypothetical protein